MQQRSLPSVLYVGFSTPWTKPACHYDLRLYCLQEIRWIETFPIGRGLGDLIRKLGFNQSSFLEEARR